MKPSSSGSKDHPVWHEVSRSYRGQRLCPERCTFKHLVPLSPPPPLPLMKIGCDDEDKGADGTPSLRPSFPPSRPPPPVCECGQCLETSVAMGCLSLVMTPDCINGACLFALSSAAAGGASQANRDRVRETEAKDAAARAMLAATVTLLTPGWLLAFFLLPPFFFFSFFLLFFLSLISLCVL